MRESAAAGLFPGQMLVIEGDAKPRTGQTLPTQRAGRASAHDCNLSCFQTRRAPFFAVAGLISRRSAAIKCDRPLK